MEQRTFKVFIACALGAGIGAFTALEVARALWWVGMLVGGFVGYLTYDPMAVGRAARTAWRTVGGWQPDWAYWKAFTVISGAFMAIVFSVTTLMMIISLVVGNHGMVYDENGWFPMICVFMGLVLFLGFTIAEEDKNDQSRLRKWELAILLGNPLVAPFYGLVKLVQCTPSILRGAWRFVCVFFRLIHSDLRLLCAFDAALGASVGFFTGSALLGALIGGVMGVANYEIISKRVWKLIPR